MPARKSTEQQRRETIGFWLIVLLICVIAGIVSYQAGRNWVGQRLAEVDLQTKQEIAEPTDEATIPTVTISEEAELPLQPVVEVEERAPSEGEKLEMKLREAEERAQEHEPQDGAELHALESDRDAASQESEGSGAGEWVVVAGSFVQSENAQNQAAKLTAKGYSPLVTDITKDGITYHRVNAGSFAKREQAQELVQKLRDDDFDATIAHR